jgi:hypothetical protein
MELSPNNKCAHEILTEVTPPTHCEIEKVDDIQEESLALDENSWAYSDPTPGSLLERCPEISNVKRIIPNSGIMMLKQACQYVLTNGPLLQGQSQRNLEVIQNSKIIEIDTGTSQDSVLNHHFEENDIYYVIGLGSALGLTFLSFAMYCYCTNSPSGRRRRGIITNIPLRPLRTRTTTSRTPTIETTYSTPGVLVPVMQELNSALDQYIRTV